MKQYVVFVWMALASSSSLAPAQPPEFHAFLAPESGPMSYLAEIRFEVDETAQQFAATRSRLPTTRPSWTWSVSRKDH